MSARALSSETVHASSVAIGGRAVLIVGRSGTGKSDLALRLIDRGALLVSDDYTVLRRAGEHALASAPSTIAGRIEVRGLGVAQMATVQDVPAALFVDLDLPAERLPQPGETRMAAGVSLPVLRVAGLEASAPLKVEMALRLIGLPL